MRRPSTSMRTVAGTPPPPVSVPPDPGQPMDYLDLYGLSKPPFGGPREGNGYILFSSQKRAFELLIGHIVNGSGVILLQGEEGVGKTEMLRATGDVAAESGVQTTRVARPPAGRTNLSQLVGSLGGPESTVDTTADEAIKRFLAPPRKALLVDDIDLMPEDCIRLLLTLLRTMSSDPGGPAIVLSGAIQLDSDQKRRDLAELVPLARNTIRMPRLSPAEVQQYIERSLWIAGGTTRRLITPDALKAIVLRSGGVPASVDRLMEAAFTAGFGRGDSAITGKTIASMSGGAPREQPRQRLDLPKGLGARAIQIAAAMLLVTGASVFFYEAFNEPPRASKSATVAPQPPPPKVAVPPPAPSPAKPTEPKPTEAVAPDLMAALLKRGNQSLTLGDTAAARLLFQHAADGGSAAAATALGKTYDPDYSALGEKPDQARAAEWYRRAVKLGDAQAADLLKRLEAR
jgi:type II secretory pathway predicted ATPase ExeA